MNLSARHSSWPMSKLGPGIATVLGALLLGLGILWTTQPPAWAARLCGPTPCKFGLVLASAALLFGAVLLVMGVIAFLHRPRGTMTISMGEQASQDAEALEKIQTSVGSGKNAEAEFAPSQAELDRIDEARKELFADLPADEPKSMKETLQPTKDPQKAREKAFAAHPTKNKAKKHR